MPRVTQVVTQSALATICAGTPPSASGPTTRLLKSTGPGAPRQTATQRVSEFARPLSSAGPAGTFVTDSAADSIPPTLVTTGGRGSAGSSVSPPAIQSALRLPQRPPVSHVLHSSLTLCPGNEHTFLPEWILPSARTWSQVRLDWKEKRPVFLYSMGHPLT